MFGVKRYWSVSERLTLIMSIKPAQRRDPDGLAAELNLSVRTVLISLTIMETFGWASRIGDGEWVLTPKGNAKRNELTAKHKWGSAR